MRKALLALGVLLVAPSLGSNLSAQSAPPSAVHGTSTCSSGLRGGGPNCLPTRRLLIVVTVNGSAPSPQIQSLIGLAASAGGAFALTPKNATASDSSVYAVLNVTRDGNGNYRIERESFGCWREIS